MRHLKLLRGQWVLCYFSSPCFVLCGIFWSRGIRTSQSLLPYPAMCPIRVTPIYRTRVWRRRLIEWWSRPLTKHPLQLEIHCWLELVGEVWNSFAINPMRSIASYQWRDQDNNGCYFEVCVHPVLSDEMGLLSSLLYTFLFSKHILSFYDVWTGSWCWNDNNDIPMKLINGISLQGLGPF